MKKALLICLIISLFSELKAQEAAEAAPQPEAQAETPVTSSTGAKLSKPLGRVKSTTSVNSESSSFMGDPDNIDPLNPNRENLKDDEEPVLEDIKQVLSAPKKKKSAGKATGKKGSGDVSESPVDQPVDSEAEKSGLSHDDPDLKLEKKFHTIYKRYNINPTPAEIWSAATAKQALREYVVQKGDTLWTISKILFGDSNFWPKIWALNKQGILNPHFIYPNSKIYFYMGDEESPPTLSVDTPNEEQKPAEDTEQEAASGENAADGALAQGAAAEITSSGQPGAPAGVNAPVPKKKKTKLSENPTKLPKSFPLSRNEKYFGEKKPAAEIKIEMNNFPRFDYETVNDIYITDKVVKEDVEIKIAETQRFRCYEGRIIRSIKYIGKLVEDYDIFERLSDFRSTAGTMHAYRAYGKARPYQGKYLKITNCSGLLTTDLVIVAKEKIHTYRNKRITPTKNAAVIGGPDVVNQNLFAPNQVIYVDFGNYPFQPGQEFKVMSQVTDEINGSIKIIDKFGSFGVVSLTDVNDVIAIGDKVILN